MFHQGGIRNEQEGDADAIRRVHLEAFGGDVEARIVDLLRKRGKSVISLVHSIDDQIVGHVVFSPVSVAEAAAGFRALGLGPVGVLPVCQRKGIGSALIRKGLQQCDAAGYDAVVLIGAPQYYSRFGLKPARAFGLENEWGVGDEFMVLRLREGALDEVQGLVRYGDEFRQ
jgi:putative acetyltransferase